MTRGTSPGLVSCAWALGLPPANKQGRAQPHQSVTEQVSARCGLELQCKLQISVFEFYNFCCFLIVIRTQQALHSHYIQVSSLGLICLSVIKSPCLADSITGTTQSKKAQRKEKEPKNTTLLTAAPALGGASHLVAGVQNVGAVPPLGEDDVVLLLPLQAAALRCFSGVHGVVVLPRRREEKRQC